MSASSLLSYLYDKGTKLSSRNITDSEFWLETQDGSVAIKFSIDNNAHKVSYNVFLPEFNKYFKEEDIRDVEKLTSLIEKKGQEYEKSVEDSWITLDWVKMWAQENKYLVEENEI